jgi:lysophospholipase L1-like esterase
MNTNPGKTFGGRFKSWLTATIVLVFLFEMLCSMIFFQKYGTAPLATIQLIKKYTDKTVPQSLYHQMHVLTRQDSGRQTCIQIADEIWAANKYTYEPWLMFRVSDYNSKYVNVKGFERRCSPSEVINPLSRDTIDIFFFGGSTMYGWNLSDAETIPSQLLNIYKSKYPNGKSVRIRNYGITYYYSKQELMLLSKLIFEGERPDIVIFMDGLNDFYPSRMLFYDRPYFAYAMQQVLDDQMFEKSRRTIVDSSEIFYKDVRNVDASEYYHYLSKKYLGYVKHGTDLAKMAGAKSYFVCQPVPFFNYPANAKDPISHKDKSDRFNFIYPLLRQQQDSIPNFLFLGDMLQNENGFPFIDQLHYSPAFAGKIANNIFRKIEKDLTN